jgi:hypothetical protein
MNIDPDGKALLEVVLLKYHGEAGPLQSAMIHQSGETAIVQIANEYYRYRLLPTAREILRGHQRVWTSPSDLFERID